MRAAGSPGTCGAGYRTTVHKPYWHTALESPFCVGCGDNWPCLPHRQAHPVCSCGHPQPDHGTDRRDRPTCFGSSMCGCQTFRPEETK